MEKKLTDLSYLNEISMGDESLIIEMIELFLTNAPASIDNLKDFVSEQNWRRLAAEAHKFKPNMAYMGLNDSKKALEELERLAKEEKVSEINSLIAFVEQRCNVACQELKAKLDELKTA